MSNENTRKMMGQFIQAPNLDLPALPESKKHYREVSIYANPVSENVYSTISYTDPQTEKQIIILIPFELNEVVALQNAEDAYKRLHQARLTGPYVSSNPHSFPERALWTNRTMTIQHAHLASVYPREMYTLQRNVLSLNSPTSSSAKQAVQDFETLGQLSTKFNVNEIV